MLPHTAYAQTHNTKSSLCASPGYAICGLGTGEDPAQRPALIAASLEGLGLAPEAAAARVVFASGVVGGPDELLEAVAAGVDLMDCGFVAQVGGWHGVGVCVVGPERVRRKVVGRGLGRRCVRWSRGQAGLEQGRACAGQAGARGACRLGREMVVIWCSAWGTCVFTVWRP